MKRDRLFEFWSWKQALVRQRELSRFVIARTPHGLKPKLLCGIDVAYEGKYGFASAVLWNMDTLSFEEKARSRGIVKVDYLPGFLGFREGPLLASAAKKLRTRADVFLVDGHGQAHPRRFGLACQVGLCLDKPTIGVAKSGFYGQTVGDNVMGPDKEVLGKVVATGSGNTYYVSVGHKIGLNDATRIVNACLINHQPAPLRAAHLEAARLRRLGG